MSWEKILQGLGSMGGGTGSSTNNGSNLGGLLGSLLGGGLGYLDAKNQPDSLTVKNEIDPRLADFAYGANGLAPMVQNLLQQQQGQPNPLTDAGKQISGMANTQPDWNTLVGDAKGQWDANPYIKQMDDALTASSTKNLLENIMPSITSGANMAGGYGGSRQGIARGKSIGEMYQGLAPARANLALNAWESGQNRALNSAQSAGSYGLNNQMQQANLLGTGAGLQANGPWNNINNASNFMRSLPGNSSTTTPLFTNPFNAAAGGAALGGQVGSGNNNWNYGDIFKGIGGLFDWFKKA